MNSTKKILTRNEAIEAMREGYTVRLRSWPHGATMVMEDRTGADPVLVRRERLSTALKSEPYGGQFDNWEVVLAPCEQTQPQVCSPVPATAAKGPT